jgi:hypothetical protein
MREPPERAMKCGDHWWRRSSAWQERLQSMADPERLELPTPAFEAQCSIQLSYGSNPST